MNPWGGNEMFKTLERVHVTIHLELFHFTTVLERYSKYLN